MPTFQDVRTVQDQYIYAMKMFKCGNKEEGIKWLRLSALGNSLHNPNGSVIAMKQMAIRYPKEATFWLKSAAEKEDHDARRASAQQQPPQP
jgi:hypothetical protein